MASSLFGVADQDDQGRAAAGVASTLAPGGVLVVEAFAPDVGRYRDHGQSPQVREVDARGPHLAATLHDPVRQTLTSQQVVVTGERVRLCRSMSRCIWPAELDLMCRLARDPRRVDGCPRRCPRPPSRRSSGHGRREHADRIERTTASCDRDITAQDLPADRYDVVLESVGGVGSEPILTAVTAVAPLGQVVAIGVYRRPATADLPVRRLLDKESTLRGSKACRVNNERDDFATALELLATQTRDFSSIITATPTWTPGDPQSPALELRQPLKTVYVIARA